MDWAVILAGGTGTRLRSLTRELMGDDRPKQFCRLVDGVTPLAGTRARLAAVVPPSRTLTIVTREHESFYRPALADCHPLTIVEQPYSRGTAAAIAYSLARLAWFDDDAVVGFFPSDHHFGDAPAMRRAVAAAYAEAATRRQRVLLLGVEPERAETEYGWIEPGAGVADGVWAVKQFWEKPSQAIAEDLFRRGCLWNTFIMVGTAVAFQRMIQTAVPHLWTRFEVLAQRRGPAAERVVAEMVYEDLPPVDFSHQILGPSADRLGVSRLVRCGWTDLGLPGPVRALLAQRRQLTVPVSISAAESPRVAAG